MLASAGAHACNASSYTSLSTPRGCDSTHNAAVRFEDREIVDLTHFHALQSEWTHSGLVPKVSAVRPRPIYWGELLL